MPTNHDDDIKQYIKRYAEAQAPDAWAGIERRIIEMEQNKAKNNKKHFGWMAAVTACGVVALLAAAVAARPAFLFGAPGATVPATAAASSAAATAAAGITATAATATETYATASAAATPDAQVREPVPFSDSTVLTKDKGPSMDIRFYESLKELAQSQWAKDIGEFRFVRVTGSVAADDGRRLYTLYEMEAVKVFKGALKPGDRITVRTFGGSNDNVWVEDDYTEKFTSDFEYMLFLDSFADEGKTVYQLASPLQGYVPLRGGAVSLNSKITGNGLFRHGEELADLEDRIVEALKK